MGDEQSRLSALRATQILDTPPTEAFDRFTDLAANLFETPIALVSLVDEHRQWFKSRKGVDAVSTPRSWAFCDHAIAQGPRATLVVENAAADARFEHNPLVTGDPGIRFYAGAVVTDAGGHNLGTLCVIDSKPRRPSKRKLLQLRMLADMVAAEIENARLSANLAGMHQRMQLAADAGRMGVWEWDFERGAIAWDERMFKLFQCPHGPPPSFEQMKAFTHPDDVEFTLAALAEAMRSGGRMERDFRIITPSGETRVMRSFGQVRRDGLGVARSMVGFMWDISDRQAKLELFENAFQYASTGEALVALDGSLMKVNPAFCALLGYSAEELLKVDFQRITHPDDLGADLSLLERLTAGEIDSYTMDKRYLRADGSEVWAHLSVSMVENTDRTPRHYISQIQDMTARRTAECALKHSEERYRLMAENSTDVIVTTSFEGVTTFVAPSCEAMIGYASADLTGRIALEFAHPEDRPRMSEVFRGLRDTGVQAPVRWRMDHKLTGATLWLESNPSLLRDPVTGTPTGYLDVIRDVTRQVAQEDALTAARAEAEAASAVKSEFLANMSHEIRTPLTAIIGFSDLLRNAAGDPALAERCVDRIRGAGEALLSIVNDVLDFSKLEAGQFEIASRPTPIRDLANETLTLFTPQAEAKGLQLHFEADEATPAWVMADPDRVRQVLLNLIGNALKFTTEGQVSVQLSYRASGERLRVEVRDTGAGMSRSQQRKLFQRFSQVDASSTRKHGGTGLGLAICKGLSEAMGGGVSVESEPGVGSTFAFEIIAPATTAPDQIAAGDAEPLMGLAGYRILVVDDNPVNRELARVVLESVGAEVTDAGSGAAGLEKAAEAPYDIILLDVRMPDLNGSQVLQIIRARPGPNQYIPILAFTAEPEFLSDATGFDGYASKPVVLAELFATIVSAIENHDSGRQEPRLDACA